MTETVPSSGRGGTAAAMAQMQFRRDLNRRQKSIPRSSNAVGVAICAVALRARYFRVATYTGTSCANMMS